MKIHSRVVATLVIVLASAATCGAAQPVNCATVTASLYAAQYPAYGALGKGAYREAEAGFRRAVSLFSACPRQTRREDEARARQVLAATSWHVGKRYAAYAQLRALRRLNERYRLADGVASTSADAFARRDYRRAYELFIASQWDTYNDYLPLPAGIYDSGAADAIREALDAGAAGDFAVALARANRALKAEPGSQATRFVAGIANLATMHAQRARALLFDALLGYDANPRGNQLTNFSLSAAYVLVAVEDAGRAR